MRIYLIVAAIGLAGCSSESSEVEKCDQIANPASEHCLKMGGRLEIRKEAGGEVGYCHLPDGRIIEEWELLRKAMPDNSFKPTGMLRRRPDIKRAESSVAQASAEVGIAVAELYPRLT
jgi:hypothetical protein